jgi:tripartite-type tricarboxylate transporter receptor subunit TctC
VSSTQRSALLPDVPTIAESGLPGFEFTFWNGVWAPAGTPAAITEQISRDLAQIVHTPEVRARLSRLGAEPMAMTPKEFSRFVDAEIEIDQRIVKASGIKAQ